MTAGTMGGNPALAMASSPLRRMKAPISSETDLKTSSMRLGWMRPSRINRSIVWRATSSRTGSKAERTTALGVSSTSTVTPVVASNDRMFLPSRPMMRPFMSSPVNATVAVVVSKV